MRINAFITKAAIVRDILTHLGEPITPPTAGWPSGSFVVRPHAKDANFAFLLEHFIDEAMSNIDSP